MKLVHCLHNNFGDALNPYIFRRLAPRLFDDDQRTAFFGIGTIIGLLKPPATAERVVVFSSGYSPQYSKALDLAKFEFACVRGPRTAQALGLHADTALCDGAYLLRDIVKSRPVKRYRASFMPHECSMQEYPEWHRLCAAAGVHFIHPHGDVNKVIEEIQASECLFAEAMHGAIVADCLRVPWVPCVSHQGINRFKWDDFCQSMQLSYVPHVMPALFGLSSASRKIGIFFRNRVRLGSNLFPTILVRPYLLYQELVSAPQLVNALRRAFQVTPILSADAIWEGKCRAIAQKLDEVANHGAARRWAKVSGRSVRLA